LRQLKIIGKENKTPETVIVTRRKHDIIIKCNKVVFQKAIYINNSDWEGDSGASRIALDVVLNLGLSSAIDSASGADNRYEPNVNITLTPLK
jgi:hypothetical protein